MKKLFTFAAALIASITMMAQETSTIFLWQYDGSSVYGDGDTNGVFEVTPAASTGSIAFITYEKKKTSADGTSAYATSVTDADLMPTITKVCKLGNNGAHMRISPASGNFMAGDTIYICGYKDFIVSTSSDPTSTAKINSADGGATIIASALATGSEKGACKVGYVVLPEDFVETNEIYISRANGTSAGIAAIKVVRPEQREVDHVAETLIGAAINGVALEETEMSTLLNNKEFEDPAYYVEAPTVTFTVQTDTYYVGEETPSTKSKNIDVVAELAAGMWTAQLTVNNETTYTIRATKPETRTITFMDGETVLGTEVVAKGDPSTKHANFETMPLAKFEGWFRNPDFTSQIDIETYAINEDQPLYGKFTKAYASSLNIEQLVLDNGKGAKIDSILTARGYEFANINELDSLNDAKANRNEPYLGLKIKKTGGYIAFNVLAGKTLAVKFGYGEAPIKINVNGVDSTYSPVNKNLGEFDLSAAQADTYIKISTTSDKTVVIKQIMIDEAIADVVLPDQPEFTAAAAPAVNGSILLNGVDTLKAHQGDTIMVTYIAASGYQIDTIKVDGKAIKEDQGIYKFVMPGNNVTVTATFKVYEETSFAITIAQSIANGNVSLNKHSANQGDTIIVTATPYDGYKIGQVTYGNEVIVPVDGIYFFIMPDHAVEVNVTFIEDKPVVPTYLVSISAPQNGTIEFADLGNEDHKYAQGDEVHLVITPAEGYKLVNANAGNAALTPDADGKCSFVMPGQDVTVSATFAPISEGIEDVNAADKAVKRLENGMLVIEKNGKVYNILGAHVK